MNPRAKDMIGSRRPVIAVNPGGVALSVVEAAAAAGADLLFIDCERTAVGIESVPALARTAQACGMSAVVRSPSKDAAILTRYLDCGVDGLVVPQVESAAQCAHIVATARAATKGAGRLLLIPQIESVEGHRHLEAIAGAPGIDLVLVGPNDLAHSMGLLGDTARPELVAALDDITGRLAASGMAFGLPASAQTAADWVNRGALFLYTTLRDLIAPTLRQIREAAP